MEKTDLYYLGRLELINEIKDNINKILDEYKDKKNDENLMFDIIYMLKNLKADKKE